MSRIRAIFLGTPDIARHCLEALIKDSHFEVVGVITQPDRPAGRNMKPQPSAVKELVRPLGIPILTPESVNTPEVLAQVAEFKAEVAVVVAFGQILKQPFLDLFPKKIVNLHASLLPRWRGAAPMQRVLMNGDSETGVSLQVMVRKLDAGPILGVRRIPISDQMTASDLYQSCKTLGVQLLEVDLMDYLRGHLTPVEQDESMATYAPKIDKSESVIDWRWPASRVHNLIRGLNLGPVAETVRQSQRLKIHAARPNAFHAPGLAPGQACRIQENSLLVQCGEGSLELLIVQPESRSRLKIAEYLRGYPVTVGEIFGGTAQGK